MARNTPTTADAQQATLFEAGRAPGSAGVGFDAIQLDNATVSDATGPIHFEGFEGEAVGAIETDDGVVTYKDFIERLLDDSAPLESYYEGTCEGKFQVCALDCDAYDDLMCEEAVQ